MNGRQREFSTARPPAAASPFRRYCNIKLCLVIIKRYSKGLSWDTNEVDLLNRICFLPQCSMSASAGPRFVDGRVSWVGPTLFHGLRP